MKIKLSYHTPRKSEGTTIIPRKVSIHTRIRKIILEEMHLVSDALHVMRKDTSPKIFLEIKVSFTRKRITKEDIMLTLQRMMNLQGRELKKKVKILQAMRSMF